MHASLGVGQGHRQAVREARATGMSQLGSKKVSFSRELVPAHNAAQFTGMQKAVRFNQNFKKVGGTDRDGSGRNMI